MRFRPWCADCACIPPIVMTWTVQGCGGIANVGATFTVTDSGGSTVESGTTDASGHYVSTATYAAGATIHSVASQSGYDTLTTTHTVPSSSGTFTALQLVPVATLTATDGTNSFSLARTIVGGVASWGITTRFPTPYTPGTSQPCGDFYPICPDTSVHTPQANTRQGFQAGDCDLGIGFGCVSMGITIPVTSIGCAAGCPSVDNTVEAWTYQGFDGISSYFGAIYHLIVASNSDGAFLVTFSGSSDTYTGLPALPVGLDWTVHA